MTTVEEIKAEYASSLADLTFNSKPLINVLTMLADENSPNAKVIVEAIETHLSKVATDIKLTILYLIDCIVKNVGGTYTTLFSQNIVSTFCGVFKAVDEKTRAEMFKLRQTWNDVFPQMKLYAIDVQINLLDPAWPVTAKPPSNSIHFNPKFLKTTTTTSKPKLDTSDSTQMITSTTVPANVDKETLLMHEKLIQKQKELLELQQKKLELEVLQTRVKLQEQIKNKGPAVSLPTRPQNILLKPEVAEQLVPSAIKHKPAGINTASLMQQRGQNSVGNGPRINPVSSALVSAAKPIRDPRLLRQQQKTTNSNSNIPLEQKTSVLENNKIVTNKMGIRKIRNDPRLINKDDNFPQKIDTTKSNNLSKSRNSDLVQKSHKTSRTSPKGSSDSNSTKSSSSSSLDSPTKSKSEKKLPVKHKKRDKSDDKKIFTKDDKREKVLKSDSPTTTFKGVKNSTKNRNYIRRNLGAISPEPQHDEDLRSLGPPEKQPRLQGDSTDDQSSSVVSTTKGMDTDLRQLPSVIGKKRPSIDGDEQSPVKRSKMEVFDKLFGDEDTDLRQLPINNDRPPTPPPPIISSSSSVKEKESPKSNLDAVRAKLANATNRDKIMSKSFNKKKMATMKDQDLRVAKVSSTTDIPNKIIISPEDESSIKSGTLTNEQGTNLLNKIIMQMEKNKLKEAKKKDSEESFNVSLQPISDDELIDSDEEKSVGKKPLSEIIEIKDTNVIPFNDKDERFRSSHLQQKPDFLHSNFHPRDLRRPPLHTWRGGTRGARRFWDPSGYPRMPSRPWSHMNSWRNTQSGFPMQRDFAASEKEEEMPGSPNMSDEQLTNGAVNQDEIKTIIIDGAPKDIRFYDETGVVFINWDNPREISFQDGVRRVTFNDTESYVLEFNKPYQEVLINGSPHAVRLGAPSREIYIDHVPYECYFGSAGIRIMLDGVSTTVKLDGPPPQVKISGEKRTDLVAGKINLFINAQIVVPVFLDAKVQKFIIDGETSTLKFVNALETVLINDVPFSVEYGGLPKPISIHGKKQFIRFSVLPKGVKPGHVIIKDMEGQGSDSTKYEENSQDSLSALDANEPALPVVAQMKQQGSGDSPDRNSNSPSFLQNFLQQQSLNNLDALSNVMTPSSGSVSTGGYQIENIPQEATQSTNIPQTTAPVLPPTLNINDLFQKLVASGFVTSGHEQKTSITPRDNITKPAELEAVSKDNKFIHEASSSSSQALPAKPLKKSLHDTLKPITFAKPETLKVRQAGLYTMLYAGMQCSSCGMRFSPEASMQYSQHLDWHFRQNRKGKRNTRVATSRKWYYSLSDWKNYEEFEDLEEREKNYFDQQQQAENAGEEGEEEVEIPSVPADPESTDECCEVCHEKFDQFFNEEKEEWHLRNAIRMENKTYHPICYEDYQQSFLEQSVDESKAEEPSKEEKSEEVSIPGLEIIIDDDEEEQEGSETNAKETTDVVSLESDESKLQPEEEPKEESQDMPEEEDDDDVILNEIAPIKIVVDDDDDDIKDESSTSEHIMVKEEKLDDGFVEVAGLVSLQNGGQIKIKAEPIDPDELPMASEKTIAEEEKQAEDKPSESVPTHLEVITSIDGNIEIVSNASSVVPTSGISGNKIKINISKPLPVIPAKEKDNKSESEFPAATTYVDPSEPFPPGEEPEPVSIKPALQGLKLKKLPPVKRGTELSGLCAIM